MVDRNGSRLIYGGIIILVLSRKIGETIKINDNIIIEVVEIQNGKIKLGIVAPKEVPILRDDAKNKEQK